MNDFVFNLDTEVASTAGNGGGSFGTMETGIYDIVIDHAVLSKTKSGNNKLDLSFTTTDGHNTTIYQAFMMDEKWTTGSDNFGYKDWQAFAVVAGLSSFTTFQKQLLKDDGTPVLKNGTPIVLTAVKELEAKKLKLAIVKSLDAYQGEVTEKNEIFASFTEAGLNANEKTNSLESTALGKLDGRLSDKKSKKYKAFIADGGSTEEVAEAEEATTDEDLGL
ncbi:MAG: hypothetical protein GQ570_08430 [Helicobacteraceae bacterium]|nr:hypothetical protein [Helicobacteraceae bacterium]